MTKHVADVLVEALQAAGVKRCYGIVGDTLNRIAHQGLARSARPRAPGCQSESNAARVAAVAIRAAGGRDRDGGLHRSSRAARQGKDVWEMVKENV